MRTSTRRSSRQGFVSSSPWGPSSGVRVCMAGKSFRRVWSDARVMGSVLARCNWRGCGDIVAHRVREMSAHLAQRHPEILHGGQQLQQVCNVLPYQWTREKVLQSGGPILPLPKKADH